MTKIRMRTLYAGPAGVIPPGNVGSVDEETAEALVAGGYAERLGGVETAEAPAAPETAAKTGKRPRGKPAPPEAADAPAAPETDGAGDGDDAEEPENDNAEDAEAGEDE